jgi:uncharacterized protein YlxP (DUF503 family)
MRVLIVTLDLHLPGVRSLKERRGILEPLKHRLRRDLNLSVSEVRPRHLSDMARLGVAAVVDHRADGDAQLERLNAIVERQRRIVVVEQSAEYW